MGGEERGGCCQLQTLAAAWEWSARWQTDSVVRDSDSEGRLR